MKSFNIASDFNVWNRLSLDRQGWREGVKSSGICFFMQNWFAQNSNERHRKDDPSYVDKECYMFRGGHKGG